MISVATLAFDDLSQSEKNERTDLLADILSVTGLLWGHRGYFSRAITAIRRCHELQSDLEEKKWVSLSWIEVNLGNVLASNGEYDEALLWELRAEETRKKVEDNGARPNGIIQQNIGRCYTFLNQFEKAQERLDSATREFEGSKNWAMLALRV